MEIRPIDKEEYPQGHAFQAEYLDQESFENFVSRVETNPDLYLGAFEAHDLIGVCYGHPSPKKSSAIQLQGIAVRLDTEHARRGIGSSLIKAFESAVRQKGVFEVDLGAADDPKVEHFYLKNGYTPYELVVKDGDHKEIERVTVSDYREGQEKREVFRQSPQVKETILVFRKMLE